MSNKDNLRKIYDDYLDNFTKLAEYTETTIKSCLKDNFVGLKKYERLEISIRVKEFNKCITKLTKEGGELEDDTDLLKDLNDIVGVRIMVFPDYLLHEINKRIKKTFKNLNADHGPDKQYL